MTNSLVQLFGPFSALTRFDRDFDRFAAHPQTERLIAPACDVIETESQFKLAVDLPGFSRKEIGIEAHDGTLRITAQRKLERKSEDDGLFRSYERAYGKLERTFTLPSEVDAGRIEAKYVDGVLNIDIPKVEAAKPKQIPIQEAS